MTVRTRAELNSDADANLADNSAGDISAADVRASVKNLADSAVLPGDTPYLVGVELGHATDTTVSRGAAGFIAVEGNRVPSPASQASGDILYRGTTEWERLAKGTAAQVLTMNAGATAPEWAAPASQFDDIAGRIRGRNRQTGTTYTFVLGDAGKLVEGNNASAQTYTVPPNSTTAFPVDTTVINVGQYGAGQITIAAGAGVTIRSSGSKLKLSGQYSTAALVKIGTDEWWLFGDISA